MHIFSNRAWRTLALAFALSVPLGTTIAAPAHVHGQAEVDIVVDGGRLSVVMQSPLEALVGFERPPKAGNEHKAVTELMRKLKDGAALVKPNLEAACVLVGDRVGAPVLKIGAVASGEHADLEASWDFECMQPLRLDRVDLGLLDAFSRLRKLDLRVTIAGAKRAVSLQRPQRRVSLAP